MNSSLERLLSTRKNFIALVKGLTTDELNTIPKGFSNNIIWNFAHTLASQQILCYKLSDLPMSMGAEFVDAYKKGSKPNGRVTEKDIKHYLDQAITLVEELESDLNSNRFKSFDQYVTSYGIAINNIEDAINFVNIHEGLHLGYAMAQRKALRSQT